MKKIKAYKHKNCQNTIFAFSKKDAAKTIGCADYWNFNIIDGDVCSAELYKKRSDIYVTISFEVSVELGALVTKQGF